MIDLTKQKDVFVLRLQAGQNALNPDLIGAIHAALDEVEGSSGPAALVTTGVDKYYCYGLDLPWMKKNKYSPREIAPLIHSVLERLIVFPMITVGAINGHVFGAGAILSLAHDYRIMREDRGYWCLPEVDIGMGFPPASCHLLTSLLSTGTAREAMVTGRRFDAAAALAGGIATHTATMDDLLDKSVTLAQQHAAKDRQAVGSIKKNLFTPVLAPFSSD